MNLQEADQKTLRVASDSQVRKVEVCGGNISLVVDFSAPSTGITSDNVFESKGSKDDDEGQEFLDGNLVWVMTKSHKWWPGEVVGYKADAKDSFMVRYIGHPQLVSWCSPSKLKPFSESFHKVVNLINDKGFFLAVEKAMHLLSNSLRLEMTCSCFAQGNGIMSPRLGTTRKIKPLILREFSVDRLEPKEFVTELKNLAMCAANTGILEITVMQARLSAFYSFSGHKQLPVSQLHQTEARKSFTTKMKDNHFVGSPSIVAGTSRTRFRKKWFREFISEVDNVSARDNLVNLPLSHLIHNLHHLAVDYKCSQETDNMALVEWFFSKFRISVFHDENAYKMQLANMARAKDSYLGSKSKKKLGNSKTQPLSSVLVAAAEHKTEKPNIKFFSGVSVADTEQTTRNSDKLNIETFNGVSTADNEQKNSGKSEIKHIIGHSGYSNSVASELSAKETSSVSSPQEKVSWAHSLSRPAATLVPDLNSGGNAFGSAEFDRLQTPETLIVPSVLPQQERPRLMMLNFQVGAPCSTYGISGTGQPVSERKFTSADLVTNVAISGKKKRGRKRKNTEEQPLDAHVTTGIPDLNGISAEAALVLPQAEPTQRRRRSKKEELPNRLTKAITVLFLKFSSQASMPSRDDLTSTFSAFGPLDSSETHVSEEYVGAQVAFVSCGDAIEALKSLEKANPFGETLVSFKLQQKLIAVQKNIAPRMPVIRNVSLLPKPSNTLPKLSNTLTMDSMRQNLMMMTDMLEKSGDRLSRETKAKLKSDIAGLLERVSSMPSSSSS